MRDFGKDFFGVDKKYVIYHIICNISRVPFVVSLSKNVLLSPFQE